MTGPSPEAGPGQGRTSDPAREPKARAGRPRDTNLNDAIRISPDGRARLGEVQKEFRELLHRHAVLKARRRGSRSVDNADIDTAYQALLDPPPRSRLLIALSEVATLVGAVAVGFATNILTADSPAVVPGLVLLLVGLFVALIGPAIRYSGR